MLILQGTPFTCGRAEYSDHSLHHSEPTAKVFVKVHFSSLSQPLLAQLDTGAAWSILAPELAEAVGVAVEAGDPTILRTHFGIKRGYLVQVPFTLIADDGDHLNTEGTFFVAPDWPSGQVFLGYSGLLDSIRFALDPQANHFYFGPGG